MRKNLVFFGRERSLKAPSSRLLGVFDVALSIGTLVGYLQLDDTNFNRKADTADRKLSALKLHLEALKRENPKISVEVDAQTAKIDELKAKIDELKAKAATGADVRVDIAQAMIDMDRVQAKVRELHGKTIDIKVDEKHAVSAFSNLTTSIMALGPAIIPVTAAATGLVAALGAPIAAAAGGGGLYAFIAAKAVTQTEAQSKALDALKKKVDAAQLSLNKATTAAGRKSAYATLVQDTKDYNTALAKVNPEQRKFLEAQDKVGTAFTALERSAGTSVFGPLTQGMDLLAKDMPKIAPVLKSVSGALNDLIKEASHSSALTSLIKFLDAFSGPSIKAAGHILGNLAVGMGGLLKAFLPLSTTLSHGLEGLSAKFANFGRSAGSNKGLQSFIAYIEEVGPKVVRTFGDLVTAAVHLGVALAPIGSVSLGALDDLAKIIDKIPAGVLGGIAASIIAVSVALKALMIARAVAGAFVVLDAAMDANPIGVIALALVGLGAGLVYAYKHSETFRDIVNGSFTAVATAAKWMWNNALKPVFKFIANDWILTAQIIVDGASKAFGWIPFLRGKLKHAAAAISQFRDDVNNTLDGIKSPTVSVRVDTMQAKAAISAVKAELHSLPPSIRTAYYVTQVNTIGKGHVTPHKAAGGALIGAGLPTSYALEGAAA